MRSLYESILDVEYSDVISNSVEKNVSDAKRLEDLIISLKGATPKKVEEVAPKILQVLQDIEVFDKNITYEIKCKKSRSGAESSSGHITYAGPHRRKNDMPHITVKYNKADAEIIIFDDGKFGHSGLSAEQYDRLVALGQSFFGKLKYRKFGNGCQFNLSGKL